MDTQASVALQKLINALAGLDVRSCDRALPKSKPAHLHTTCQQTWITAYRVRDLVQNAKVQVDRTLNLPSRRPVGGTHDQTQTQSQGSTRQKRSADVAFDEITFPPPPRGMATISAAPAAYQHPAHNGQSRLQPSHVYHPSLQGEDPTHSAYAGYMPGYDSWWPVLESQTDVSAGAASGPVGSTRHPADGSARSAEIEIIVPTHSAGPGAVGLPSQDFTFTTQHFSPAVLQAMRDPVIHFPSAFAHHGY